MDTPSQKADGFSVGGRSSSQASNATSVTSLGINPFGFEARTSFDASQDLMNSRSENFEIKPPPVDDDIWKRAPPNFRPQNFLAQPPKRNSRDAMQPWKYGTIPGQREFVKRPKVTVLPHILNPKPADDKRFITQFHTLDPFEARQLIVKEAFVKPEVYLNPKPHDYRQYPPIKSLGLDEFETGAEKDPFNINFKSNRLNIIWDIPMFRATRDIKGLQMCPPTKPEAKYEPDLILPRDPYPNKECTFSRYRRRNRSPHTGLMDRIEEVLMEKWARERAEKARDKLLSLPRLTQSSTM